MKPSVWRNTKSKKLVTLINTHNILDEVVCVFIDENKELNECTLDFFRTHYTFTNFED
jgi:hypothetical protein